MPSSPSTTLSAGGAPTKPRFPTKFIVLGALLGWAIAWVCGAGSRDEFVSGKGEKTSDLNRVIASGPEPPSVRGKYGGTITDTALADPKTFNYWVSSDAGSTGAVGGLYDTLIGQNAYTLAWEGRLSELPQISADGLTWTFHLKPNLKWSDGQPLTSADVIFTLDMIYDPKTQGIMREGMLVTIPDKKTKKLVQEPLGYKALDDRTVQFKFPVPYAPARSMLSFPIAPRHKLYDAWKSGNINSTWSISTPPKELVACGPWTLQSYVPGQRLVYARNPYYWKKDKWGGALPYFDRGVSLIVPDLSAMNLTFKSGASDSLAVPAMDYPSFKKEEKPGPDGYTLYDTGPSFGFQFLGFNLNPNAKVEAWKKSLFQNTKFRQAVSYSINRNLMCINLFRGLAVPGWSPITPANKLFFNPNTPTYPYDIDKAKKLLDEIGAKDTDGDGVREWQGHPIEFIIQTNVENNVRKSLGVVISKDLKDIGLNPTFTPVAFNKIITALDNPPYEWDSIILGFTGGIEPHDGANIWYSSGPSHQWDPSQTTPATPWEARIDQLFTLGAQTIDQKKRKGYYDEWQTIAARELPFIYTIVPDGITAVRNKFGNLKPCPQGLLWNQDELFDLSATRTSP